MLAAIYNDPRDAASQINSGDIGVLKTDTIYGVVASASNNQAVERVYSAKGRTATKSPIVLIASIKQLFDDYADEVYDYLNQMWPGPNSIILPSTKAPDWITRGNESVAYRLPADANLRELLAKTGPIIAPSANPEGQPPAASITEAMRYFSDEIDFYVDSGSIDASISPSQLWLYDMTSGQADRLR